MINYGIFFTAGSTVIRLPLNPEELPDTQTSNNETYNVIGIGEVTALRIPAQRSISISGLFPARPEFYVHTPNQFWTPEQYINFFRSAMLEKRTLIYTPVRYMEDGTPFATSDVGFTCTVEGFEVTEKGGQTGDFWYDLSIKEYRDYSPQTVKVEVKKTVKTVSQTKKRDIPADEIVVGDTVTVSGTLTQNPSGTGTTRQTSGTQAKVVRVDETKKNPVCVKGPLETIEWTAKSSIRLVAHA